MDSFGIAHKGRSCADLSQFSRRWLKQLICAELFGESERREIIIYLERRTTVPQELLPATFFCISNVIAPATRKRKKIQIHFGWISDLKAWVSCLIFLETFLLGQAQPDRQSVGQLKQISLSLSLSLSGRVELNHTESRGASESNGHWHWNCPKFKMISFCFFVFFSRFLATSV